MEERDHAMIGAALAFVGFLVVAAAVTILPLRVLWTITYTVLLGGIGVGVVWCYWKALSGMDG